MSLEKAHTIRGLAWSGGRREAPSHVGVGQRTWRGFIDVSVTTEWGMIR
jgi:hypothetical protein